MNNIDKEIIRAGRKFLRELEKAHGKKVADEIWLGLIKLIPNGQEVANEILLDTLRYSPTFDDNESQKKDSEELFRLLREQTLKDKQMKKQWLNDN